MKQRGSVRFKRIPTILYKPKYRNRILYTPKAHRKRSSRESNPNNEKLNNSKHGRRTMPNRKRKPGTTSNAFHKKSGIKITPFELHHGRKPRAELTNIVKDGKTYLSIRSEMTISAPDRPKIPIYVGRDAEGQITTNHIIMAKTKNEKKQAGESTKSPKKKLG